MENFIRSFLSVHNIEEVVAGAPIQFESIPANKHNDVVAVLLHCCVNGPVSPHKETTFPVIGMTSLDELCGYRVTNGTLRSSCEEVANFLNSEGIEVGYLHESKGNYWPLYLNE